MIVPEHPNLDLIRSFFEAYNEKDMETMKVILDPQITWHIPGDHPLSGTKKGIHEVLDYFKRLAAYSFHAAPLVVGVNESYVIDCHRNWTNLPGDNNLDAMSCLLWRFGQGKILEVFNFPQDQGKVDRFFRRLLEK